MLSAGVVVGNRQVALVHEQSLWQELVRVLEDVDEMIQIAAAVFERNTRILLRNK